MIAIRLHSKSAVIWLAIAILIFWPMAAPVASESPPDDAAFLGSVCPVVYPLDEFPDERGYRYLFFGNAFFINDEGYLVTAAHLLHSFRDGGRPYILVSTPSGPRRLQKAEMVAEDLEHDVAILRATPNPFIGPHNVSFVPLSVERPFPGKHVMAVSILPADPADAHSADVPTEIRSQGQVANYQFHAESEGTDSELLLFSQKVVPGQSGSPVLSPDSREVVGIVVGQWLRPTLIHFGTAAKPVVTSPGAAVRTHYAIALLSRHGISWHAAPVAVAAQKGSFSPPVPVSLITTSYPAQALFGGEVLLDARIDTEGRVADLNVVHGTTPFLQPVLDAVRTWVFSPAQVDGQVVQARVGIVVGFPQSFLPKLTAREHKYNPPPEDSVGYAALPTLTVEPDYPVNTVAEESVILFNLVNQQGHITSTQVVRDVEPFTATTLAALKKWQFVPGKEDGTDTESAVIVVATFRHP